MVAETLFWALFTVAVLTRWANPDLWHQYRGGEKPMDFAYLNAVLKSTHFPPFDPWFAGGQMNYYYFGFVLIAVLVKATSIVPSIAYNLAVPTLLAFLGTAAFGATLALFPGSGRRRGRWLGRPTLVALLGALFVAVLGNLGELRVIYDSLHRTIPIEWWYSNQTRVIHHPDTESGPINELPFFTYLFGTSMRMRSRCHSQRLRSRSRSRSSATAGLETARRDEWARFHSSRLWWERCGR